MALRSSDEPEKRKWWKYLKYLVEDVLRIQMIQQFLSCPDWCFCVYANLMELLNNQQRRKKSYAKPWSFWWDDSWLDELCTSVHVSIHVLYQHVGNLGPFAAYLSMLTVHMSTTVSFIWPPPKASYPLGCILLLVQDMFKSQHVSDWGCYGWFCCKVILRN